MSTSVREFGKAWWAELCNRIIGAVVFLDDYSAECLHWDGGIFNLLNGGAVAVKPLKLFESCKKDQKKAVFITQASSTQLRRISEIIRSSDLTHCILVSCVSLDTVYLEINDGVRDVSDVVASGKAASEGAKLLERRLLEWINKKQSVVEVVYIPIFTISPTNNVFLTPPFQKVFPKFDNKLTPDMPTLDLYTLSSKERSSIRRLASGLNSMLDSMNMKEDIYYMGAFSSLVAGVLENSPICMSRRKNCTNPVSLIFVDRTLDLCGVTSHSMESVLDKVMAVLPRFPGHSTDVAVDMSPLCEANNVNYPDQMQLSPGCLFHADDESCAQTYDHMINKSQKEVMFDLYNKLSKIDVLTSPGPKTLLKVTPQSLEKIISLSKGDYDIICKHLGLLQQALGVVQTLKSPKRAQMELLMSLEKQVLQNLAASRDSTTVLHQLSHIIRTRKERDLSIDNLLALLIHVYSLTGTAVAFTKHHEDNLRIALRDALFEELLTQVFTYLEGRGEHQLSHIIRTRKERDLSIDNLLALLIHVYSLTGTEVAFTKHHEENLRIALRDALFEDRKILLIETSYTATLEECEQISKNIMDRLKEVSQMRKILQKYNSVLKPCESGTGHDYRGVLQQLVEDLVNTDRPELSDLRHRNEGIKELLRTGLNILTSKKKTSKHPLDNPTVILFVLGGITAEECKQLHRNVITSGVDNVVLIGSTRFLTPVEAMRVVLNL